MGRGTGQEGSQGCQNYFVCSVISCSLEVTERLANLIDVFARLNSGNN